MQAVSRNDKHAAQRHSNAQSSKYSEEYCSLLVYEAVGPDTQITHFDGRYFLYLRGQQRGKTGFIDTLEISVGLYGVTLHVTVISSHRCQKIVSQISKNLNWNQSSSRISKEEISSASNRVRHLRIQVMRHKNFDQSTPLYIASINPNTRFLETIPKKRQNFFARFLCCRKINYLLQYWKCWRTDWSS
jgi:hypothetical protein